MVGVAPYAQIQALAVRTPEMLPVELRGIDPAAEPSVTRLAGAITEGRLADLAAGSDSVIIGEVIAEQLGLARGDSLTLLIPTVTAGGVPAPKLRQFKVAGVFEVGLSDSDATLVFANIADVRALGPSAQGDQGLRVRYRDALSAPTLSASLRTRLPQGFQVIDWTQDNADYFRAIRIEKTMMSLILLLIVAVAAFNIVAMLVMVVTDKRTDIAILRTLGASPRRVMGVFLTQGLVIGWLGVALGVALGLAARLQRRHDRALPAEHLRLPDLQLQRLLHHQRPFHREVEQRRGDQPCGAPPHGSCDGLPGGACLAHGSCRSAALRVAGHELAL